MVIIGNKSDLESKRMVPKEVGEQVGGYVTCIQVYCISLFLQLANRTSNPYLETSAVTGHNVKKAFYRLAEALIHNHGIFQPSQEVSYVCLSTVQILMFPDSDHRYYAQVNNCALC